MSLVLEEQVRHEVEAIIAAAVKAPSSHNTQPWGFQVGDGVVKVLADRSRRLPVHDPDDRELTISCGAAAFSLAVAARRADLVTSIERLPDDADRTMLYRASLVPAGDADAAVDDLHRAIDHRRTTRGRFTDESLPDGLVTQMSDAAAEHGTWLRMDSRRHRGAVGDLIAEGDPIPATPRPIGADVEVPLPGVTSSESTAVQEVTP